MYQHLPLKGPPKFTQTGIFGLKTNHLATLTRRLVLKKGDFFQLVPNLFCVVKRGFEPCKNVPCLGWRSADFLQCFFCQKCLLDLVKQGKFNVGVVPADRLHRLFTTKIYFYSCYYWKGGSLAMSAGAIWSSCMHKCSIFKLLDFYGTDTLDNTSSKTFYMLVTPPTLPRPQQNLVNLFSCYQVMDQPVDPTWQKVSKNCRDRSQHRQR
jgi:hypothetical protein